MFGGNAHHHAPWSGAALRKWTLCKPEHRKKFINVTIKFRLWKGFSKRRISHSKTRLRGASLIISMETTGWSMRRVACQVDLSECVVRKFWYRWTQERTDVRCTGSGATIKTTKREERRIMRHALVDPKWLALRRNFDLEVSFVLQTISRCLEETNLQSKRFSVYCF